MAQKTTFRLKSKLIIQSKVNIGWTQRKYKLNNKRLILVEFRHGQTERRKSECCMWRFILQSESCSKWILNTLKEILILKVKAMWGTEGAVTAVQNYSKH